MMDCVMMNPEMQKNRSTPLAETGLVKDMPVIRRRAEHERNMRDSKPDRDYEQALEVEVTLLVTMA